MWDGFIFEKDYFYEVAILQNIEVSVDEETENIIINSADNIATYGDDEDSGYPYYIKYKKTKNNIILFAQEIFSIIFVATDEGLDYDIEGDYVKTDGYVRKWSFDGKGVATDYAPEDDGQWYIDSYGSANYFGLDGTYYLGGYEIVFNEDRTSFTWDRYTYTKATE